MKTSLKPLEYGNGLDYGSSEKKWNRETLNTWWAAETNTTVQNANRNLIEKNNQNIISVDSDKSFLNKIERLS